MAIRYGVNTWIWTSPLTTASAQELIPKVKAMGFDLFEIPLEDLALLDATTIRSLLADQGLAVSVCGAFWPTRDLGSDDAAIVVNALDYIHQCLVFCHDVGARIFAGPMYAAVGKARLMSSDERKTEFDRAVSGLKQVVPRSHSLDRLAGRASGWQSAENVCFSCRNRIASDLFSDTLLVFVQVAVADPAAVKDHGLFLFGRRLISFLC